MDVSLLKPYTSCFFFLIPPIGKQKQNTEKEDILKILWELEKYTFYMLQ